MFDIGFSELLIVAVVALLVLGPERLPSAVKTAGMWVGRIRRSLGNVQREISEELRIEEMRQAAKARQEELEKQMGSMQRPFTDSLRDEILKPAAAAKQAADRAPAKESSAAQTDDSSSSKASTNGADAAEERPSKSS